MQHDMMILVCHAVDGHFANGDRLAVRRVFDESLHIARQEVIGIDQVMITTPDGGVADVHAPGLGGSRSFQRIVLLLRSRSWTADLLDLVYDLMCTGGFGLINNLDVPYFIVTQPQQISYFPWLPEPPLLVRNAQDLAYSLGEVIH